MKRLIGVFMGGKSPEHDVSIITGTQVMCGLNQSEFDVLAVYEDYNGNLYAKQDAYDVKSVVNMAKGKNKVEYCHKGLKKRLKKYPLYCAIPCYHGGNAEGGGQAYLFEKYAIPYTSSGILGGSIGMDKLTQKELAKSVSVPVLEYSFIDSNTDINKVDLEEEKQWVIKPNANGSSIGVSKAKGREEVKKALELALNFDNKAIIERCAQDFYELNVSALKVGNSVILSEIEMPLSNGILTFEDKYLKNGKIKGMKNLTRQIPAQIPKETQNQVERFATILYEKFSLFGIVRFDFIVEGENVYFNEVNTNPGSLSYYMWRGKGITFDKLLDLAIKEGVNRAEKEQKLITRIQTGII
ncbi:MAG: ATP-grasp domain-containing protein [Clostridia bacterium]|nr:ATP-grasp domain-containing protein [Clostridia bacterium]